MLSRDLEPEQRLSRRRFLRFSVAGAAGATLASLLSACGGGGAAPTAAPAKPAEGAKPGEAAKPAAQAGPGGFSGGGSIVPLAQDLVNALLTPLNWDSLSTARASRARRTALLERAARDALDEVVQENVKENRDRQAS